MQGRKDFFASVLELVLGFVICLDAVLDMLGIWMSGYCGVKPLSLTLLNRERTPLRSLE